MKKQIENVIEYANRNKGYLIGALFAVISFIVTNYYLFTYGVAYLHGDVSISSRYARAIEWAHNLFPQNWYFVNSEIYTFRITSFATIISLITGNHIYGRVIADSLFLLIIILAIKTLYKSIFKSKGAGIAITVFLLFLGGVETRNMIMNECTYSSEMLAVVWTIPLMYTVVSYSENQNKIDGKCIRNIIFYGLILFIMILCGMRYVAEQVLPMGLAVGLYLLFQSKEKSIKNKVKSLIAPGLTMVIPFAIGWIVYKLICSSHHMNAGGMDKITIPESPEILLQNIKVTLITFVNCFGLTDTDKLFSLITLRNVISVGVCILICLIIPVLQLFKYRTEEKPVKFFLIFALCHNGIMIAITTILGKNLERYLLSSIYVFILLSVRYIYEYWLKNKLSRIVFIILFTLMTVVQIIYMLDLTKGSDDILQSHMDVVDTLKERGCTKGYGGYWTAFNYEVYSNNDIVFGQVDIRDKAHPHLWNLDYSVYEQKSDSSFLMLTDEEVDLLEVDLNELFGEAIDSFKIDNVYIFDYMNFRYYKGNLNIYQYDYDISDEFANGIADGKLTVEDMYFAEGGMVYEDGSCYVYSSGSIMGPYVRIDAGTYDVCYKGENVDELILDIQSSQNPEAVSFDVISIEDDCLEVKLYITEPVDIDFRAYVGGVDPVRFQEITVEKQ